MEEGKKYLFVFYNFLNREAKIVPGINNKIIYILLKNFFEGASKILLPATSSLWLK